jgi:hypothetical protein
MERTCTVDVSEPHKIGTETIATTVGVHRKGKQDKE